MTLIPESWTNFPDEFRTRLGSTVGRQRAMVAHDHLLIVAHEVPNPNEAARRGILFWRDPAGQWKCNSSLPNSQTLDGLIECYSKRIEELDSQESSATKADDYVPLVEGLAPVARSISNFLDTLEEARRAIPEDRKLIDHRDHVYDLSRQAELLHEEVKNSMELALVRRADEQTMAAHEMMLAAHRLNMLAAMFFPFAALGAIFGTTLTDNWSWSNSPLPFVVFLLFGGAAGWWLTRFVSRPSQSTKK